MRKKILCLLVLSVVLFVSGHSFYNVQKVQTLYENALPNLLALASLEQLDNGENSEFKYYIYKDNCIVRATAETELASLNRLLRRLGRMEVSVNVSVDLTDLTCLYSTVPNGTPPVRLGNDIRCADVWNIN